MEQLIQINKKREKSCKAVEAVGRFGLNQESKTSVACAWNKSYRKKVTAQQIVDQFAALWTNPKYGRTAKWKVNKQRRVEVAGLDESEQQRALEALRRIYPTAGCLMKAESDTDSASEDEDLPPLLSRFRDTETKDCSADDLQTRCADFLKDFIVSQHQCDNLEKMTRTQSQSLLWQRHREGRITATIAHDISTLQDTTSRETLFNRVMNRSHIDLSSVEAVAFGRKYEDQAKQLYSEWMKDRHEQFSLHETGLVVDQQFPLFAATPDGIRSCVCHGDGLVEIKCSFKHKDLCVKDIPKVDKTFYLEKDSLVLKQSHRHYTQVQFQMYVCKKLFCDFVVFTHRGVHVQTIKYDHAFLQELVSKCMFFAVDELVPVIIQQKFTS
ncbi:uncharacterized protein LOC118560572 isoform X2 [Fundulus heteroclitus]|uniref:uncharacterized protein LOC118560572 isoform X2 n=1 Tax=Fundulus heteroclitus TaxID=8078 RepID=UPI00165CD437|nr:uncharacterized protein LOC118560572 isoform X2 [Fundulus heteroclitus]XP_035987602.1 uncharacterized protein LOC118560572 isoform X2 [Fundulus heteroclitus]